MKHVLSYLVGLIFGVGISASGMANPAKVVNFFDITGHWDPSLAFVMGGAVIVAFVGYKVVFRRDGPMFAPTFTLPGSSKIDRRVIAGSAVFGIGWGIAGFCPGGALPALGTLNPQVILFVAALVSGMLTARGLMALAARRSLDKAAV